MKKRLSALILAAVMLFLFIPWGIITVTAQQSNLGELCAYPEFDKRIERDYMYSVSVEHKGGTTALPVYNHAEDSRTTRNPEDTVADEYRRFSTFAFDNKDGAVVVNIKVNRSFTSYSVIPSAKNFPSEFDESTGTIKVRLEKPEYFMVRLDGKDSTNIAIFADAPETEAPSAGENTVTVDGWQEVEGGILNLNTPNTTLYIKPGAVLNARVKVTADGCKIIGRGAIVDPFENIFTYDEKDTGDNYTLVFVSDANNTVIDGVHLLNSRAYNLEVQGIWNESYAENTAVTNVKILSTQMSSDGIMFNYYIKNATAEHCFIYCGDNALNYEDNASFTDILVGTTCNAIFPQTDVRNSSLKDIYVFRANDNIINTEYTGSGGKTTIDNHRITNLYAQDVTYTTSFLYAENPTTTENPMVSLNGGTVITNVCLPKIDGIRARFYYNISSGNHEITLKNVYVDGTPTEISVAANGTDMKGYAFPSEAWGWISYPNTHTFNFGTDASADIPASVPKSAHRVTVNYENVDKNVFVGSYQVYFANPVIEEESTVYLPYSEIKDRLGVGASANTVVRNGIKYIAHTELETAKMASDVTLSGNKLVLTPFNIGQNLLVADNSGISRFTEFRASHQYLTSADGVYTVTDKAKDDREGMFRVINEEIKKYGVGEYTLSFDIKTAGSAGKLLTLGIDYGTELDASSNCKLTYVDKTLTDTWQNVTLTFSVDEALLEENNISFIAYDRDKTLVDFSLRNITLTKSEPNAEGYTVKWSLGDRVIEDKYVKNCVPQIDFDTNKAGYSFIGWDKTVSAVTADVTYTAEYQYIGCVTLYGAQIRSTDSAVRFVGVVDDYKLQGLTNIGFDVKVGGKSVECEITKVYNSIMKGNGTVTPEKAGATFFTYCISDVPAATEFEVSVYAVIDGQKLTTSSTRYIFTGNDIVLPGLNNREDNSVEDTMDYNELFRQ